MMPLYSRSRQTMHSIPSETGLDCPFLADSDVRLGRELKTGISKINSHNATMTRISNSHNYSPKIYILYPPGVLLLLANERITSNNLFLLYLIAGKMEHGPSARRFSSKKIEAIRRICEEETERGDNDNYNGHSSEDHDTYKTSSKLQEGLLVQAEINDEMTQHHPPPMPNAFVSSALHQQKRSIYTDQKDQARRSRDLKQVLVSAKKKQLRKEKECPCYELRRQEGPNFYLLYLLALFLFLLSFFLASLFLLSVLLFLLCK